MTENHKLHIEELTKAGILDLEDLEINKSGHLSQRQIRMLYLNLAFWLTLAGFDLVILALFIYFQMFFQGNLTTGLIWGSLISVPAYLCITNARPYRMDIQNNHPNTVSGKLYKGFSRGPGIASGKSQIGYCSIGIGNQTFSISPLIYDHIIDEEHYRVYFVSNSRKLLNIEPL